MLLVLLATMVRTWKQALFIVQEDDAASLASSGVQALLEIQVQSGFCQTKDLHRDPGLLLVYKKHKWTQSRDTRKIGHRENQYSKEELYFGISSDRDFFF